MYKTRIKDAAIIEAVKIIYSPNRCKNRKIKLGCKFINNENNQLDRRSLIGLNIHQLQVLRSLIKLIISG